jgi:hypothetical protein
MKRQQLADHRDVTIPHCLSLCPPGSASSSARSSTSSLAAILRQIAVAATSAPDGQGHHEESEPLGAELRNFIR